MLTKERRPAIRTLRGWALAVLREAGVIHRSKEHGWAKDRAGSVSAREARRGVGTIGDTCPECPPRQPGAAPVTTTTLPLENLSAVRKLLVA